MLESESDLYGTLPGVEPCGVGGKAGKVQPRAEGLNPVGVFRKPSRVKGMVELRVRIEGVRTTGFV